MLVGVDTDMLAVPKNTQSESELTIVKEVVTYLSQRPLARPTTLVVDGL